MTEFTIEQDGVVSIDKTGEIYLTVIVFDLTTETHIARAHNIQLGELCEEIDNWDECREQVRAGDKVVITTYYGEAEIDVQRV